jgi:putative addiction module CopG family antidote
MTPALPPDLEQFVRDQVANGCFPTSEGVIVAGLRLLREQYSELKASLAEAQAELDRGEGTPFDPHAVLKEVLAERAARAGGVSCGG